MVTISETGRRSGNDFRRGLQPPYINLPTPKQEEHVAGLYLQFTDPFSEPSPPARYTEQRYIAAIQQTHIHCGPASNA